MFWSHFLAFVFGFIAGALACYVLFRLSNWYADSDE